MSNPSDAPASLSPPGPGTAPLEVSLRTLWEEAMLNFEKSTKKPLRRSPLFNEILYARSVDDIVRVLEKHGKALETFRSHEIAIRAFLAPLVNIVSVFLDASAEVSSASGVVPGGKAIIVAFGVFLKYLDKKLFERTRNRIYRRAVDYRDVLLGRLDVQRVLSELDRLTGDELLATVTETLVFVQDLQENTRDAQMKQEDIHDFQVDEAIKTWLNPPEPALNHERLRKLHKHGTCTWFFDAAFEEWKRGDNAVYWIYGKPGTGKSVLCSSIIDHLRFDSEASLAYFYFDFRDVHKESVSGLLSSLVFQLASSSHKCYTILKKSRTRQRMALQPTVDFLSSMLEEMLRVRPGTTLVIDALDECPELSREYDLLPLLYRLVSHDDNRLRLLMTSRPESDIRRAMDRIPSHLLKLHDADQHAQDLSICQGICQSNAQSDGWWNVFMGQPSTSNAAPLRPSGH
ncbi:hypothetical protein K488DRAFT_69721 [Vararia minispora EC-137]|uniref:Uncharacterized protein n=1 Tax=Vararia minispora EC-137 TaxID=1314806 RepID=A0ACB8QPL0_9AGAM|nr:hypothetical protein K488DRAFT_69721 [Vararia minispora EC-137]